ncbi:membrane protein [Orientia tsutsugamushi]|uniref:hypothetical protein n=1 Tax=Orientia tsutsugamushi TaxID=784 RepID=UPI0005F8C87C|nr:hypothetical protein [Orientia tsutsugamushi]KJV71719.1 putative ompA-like autotransporter [Orientia tsutsugamushi str. TA763]KJV74532.1 putative ompA-like autotransporter [Orientia tsutsugamushi str. TA763]SPP24521.1 membrane protein [Orientia tsutsugamushi]
MNVLKSLLQPCYAVILAFVVLSSQSIYSADRYNNSENSKSSIESNAFPFYIKFSTALDTNYYYIFEGGVGYRLDRHRMDVGFGFYCINKFIQGNYYYNIIEGNKASIFVTGGLMSIFRCCSCGTCIELGVGTTINFSKKDKYLEFLDIECCTIANYRPFLIYIRFGGRVHF